MSSDQPVRVNLAKGIRWTRQGQWTRRGRPPQLFFFANRKLHNPSHTGGYVFSAFRILHTAEKQKPGFPYLQGIKPGNRSSVRHGLLPQWPNLVSKISIRSARLVYITLRLRNQVARVSTHLSVLDITPTSSNPKIKPICCRSYRLSPGLHREVLCLSLVG